MSGPILKKAETSSSSSSSSSSCVSDSERPSPHAPFYRATTLPSDVRTAREAIVQSVSSADIKRARDAIDFDQPGEVVPVAELFTNDQITALITARTIVKDSSKKDVPIQDSLDDILKKLNSTEAEYEARIRKLLQEIALEWKRKHRGDAPAQLQTLTVREKRILTPGGSLDINEFAVNHTTYERALEDIEVGVMTSRGTRTILIVEMKRRYDSYREVEAAGLANKQGLLDIVNQLSLYMMKTQSAILRTGSHFVLVGLVLFMDVAFLVKLTANEWWSYLYKMDVRKYELRSAHDVFNMLQVFVSRALVVNADTNALLNFTATSVSPPLQFRHDFSQLDRPNFRLKYPSYPPEAHVQTLPTKLL